MADNSRRIAGVAYLWVDGELLPVVGDLAYCPASVTRETMTGQDGIHGYKEMPFAGYIVATIRDGGAFSVAALNGMTNVTVVAELANGKVVTGRNMWTVETQESKATEASVEVRWEGPSVSEG